MVNLRKCKLTYSLGIRWILISCLLGLQLTTIAFYWIFQHKHGIKTYTKDVHGETRLVETKWREVKEQIFDTSQTLVHQLKRSNVRVRLYNNNNKVFQSTNSGPATRTSSKLKQYEGNYGIPNPGEILLNKRTDPSNKQSATSETKTMEMFLPNKTVDGARWPKTKPKVIKILYWTKFWQREDFFFGFGNHGYYDRDCAVKDCTMTSNKNEFNSSEVIVVHINNIFTPSALPKYRFPHQKFVFFNYEPPYLTRPNLKLFNGLFNVTMTYRLDSDAINPYGSIFRRTKQEKAHFRLRDYAKGKTKLIAWFVSNCKTPSAREDYVKELRKYVKVDMFGRCGTLHCPSTQLAKCHSMLRKEYRFYLAMENGICKDYVTEKVFQIMHHDVVPIVLGGANYSKILPPHSFIDVRTFLSPKDLAEYLNLLGSNDKLYNRYFYWKLDYKIDYPYLNYFCHLCAYLHKTREYTQIYHDLYKWYSGPGVCSTPEEYYKGIADTILTNRTRKMKQNN